MRKTRNQYQNPFDGHSQQCIIVRPYGHDGLTWSDGTFYIWLRSKNHAIGYDSKMRKLWENTNFDRRANFQPLDRSSTSPICLARVLISYNVKNKKDPYDGIDW